MRRDLPTGTVTFLFTDVEGSTRLLHELGAGAYAEALSEHRRVVREACAAQGGVEVDTQGDAFFYAFPTAPGALAAARAVTAGLAGGPVRVRIGVHTGTPLLAEEGYVGHDVHRAARIAAAGHGGQILVSAATAALVAAEDLHDLGEHRLKDLSAPERIYQVGAADFPSLATLYRTNLPVPATPFVGRERELGEVLALLAREDIHLLTLTGPGGSGKTRLAAQAAAALAERYPDGVWWVPLAPLRDPALVLESAARVLGARDGLAEHVGDKRLLLLFDNFEHVLGAAADLAELLASCPNLELLATSREPLHLSGEQTYAVPPLAHEEAVGFFAARARALAPDFVVDEAVPEICRRLDELPLALELAAARVTALSTSHILERLEHRFSLLTGGARDAPERQRTLRATIEWSHDLLSPEEQRLFARLAVFRGGCTLETAEAVCEAELDDLQSLVEKSLLRFSSGRYWMLETIRELAVEKLAEGGEAEELRRRHAEHFLALAEEAEPHVSGADPVPWLDRLEREHDNLRAALDRLLAAGEGDALLRLTGSLWRFWYLRGHLTEGTNRLESALAADDRPTAARLKVLMGAASHAVVSRRDFGTARRRAEEALRLAERLEDAGAVAYSRFLFGFAAAEEGDFPGARPHLEESLERFRALGDEHFTGIAAFNLAWAYGELGERERARALAEQLLESARASGNRRRVAFALDLLEGDARRAGRLADALSLQREALRIRVEQGDAIHVADTLSRIAAVLAASGDVRTAAKLLSWSIAANQELGMDTPLYQQTRNDETLEAVRADLDEAPFAEAWDEGRRLSLDDAVALALGERDEAHVVEP
ncbi:MAG TPA: tetratricopeptide repeat protein [Gaiellaceae bacterium]|nr:tetratricopeptide repeat protein [Gaiellaceae bacterium]